MESDRFDDLIARLASPISRRRGVGLAGVLGLGGLGAVTGAAARKKKKKGKKGKKPRRTTTTPPTCRANCAGRTCGDNGCGGSCGTCGGELICRSGKCDCPEGQDLCGGTCHAACPPSTPGREVARHPATCLCCVRPGSIPCPNGTEQCCMGPEDLPCCGLPCEPLAEYGDCPVGIDPEWYGIGICHYDVECYPGYRCPEGNEPRVCEPIPG